MPISLPAGSPAPVVTLRGDLTGTAFGTAPTFTDYTAYLETGPDGAPVDITWGRQDNRADVPAGQFTFTLDNTTGIFTVGAAIIEVDHVFNVRLTADGVTTDRITGYVTSIEPTWPGGVQSWSVVRVTCVDLTGKLSTAQPLRSMVEQEMLADLPTYLYPLAEPNGATSAGDVVNPGSNLPAVRTNGKFGAATADFGADLPGLVESVTGVSFGTNLTVGSPSPATMLLLAGGSPAATFVPPNTAHTQECWFIAPTQAPTPALGGGSYANLLYQTGGATGRVWMAIDALGQLDYHVSKGAGNIANAFLARNICDGKLHHGVGVLDGDMQTVRLYLDGVQVATGTSTSPLDLSGMLYSSIGASFTTIDAYIGGQFPGTIAEVALYPTALSAARVLAHYQAGIGTLTETSDQRFARIAAYGKVTTSGLPSGQAMMAAQQTAGRTVLDVETEVARTEGTVTYPTGAGALTFQRRDNRYNRAVALTLTGDDIAGDLPIRKDKQDFFNELTVQRTGGATQVVKNAMSQAGKAGRVDGGSFTVAPSTDYDALQNASWQVAEHSPNSSRTRFPSLKVDLMSRSDSFRASVLGLGISSLVQVTTLPSQSPTPSPLLFIEGGHEVISVNEFSVEFFTSPQTIEAQAFTLDSATLGQLDAANLIAF